MQLLAETAVLLTVLPKPPKLLVTSVVAQASVMGLKVKRERSCEKCSLELVKFCEGEFGELRRR